MDLFCSLDMVSDIEAKGKTKSTVILKSGIEADVRVVDPKCFGAALQYFTGSKAHNIRVRERAVKKGLKINFPQGLNPNNAFIFIRFDKIKAH